VESNNIKDIFHIWFNLTVDQAKQLLQNIDRNHKHETCTYHQKHELFKYQHQRYSKFQNV
jgi:hypothetical protein